MHKRHMAHRILRTSRHGNRAAGLLLALALQAGSWAAGGAGARAEQASALCLAAIQSAEQRHETPPGLLATIAKVESGRPAAGGLQPWPWTIDADGQSLYFDTKEQAVA